MESLISWCADCGGDAVFDAVGGLGFFFDCR
jgi:hypothetical protein